MCSQIFYAAVLFAVGGVALLVPHGYGLGFYILALGSLVLWLRVRKSLLSADTRYFFAPLIAYALVNLAMALNEKMVLRSVDEALPYLLLPFGVWGVRRYRPKADWFWLGLAVGAAGAAVLAGYQAYVLGLRSGGYTHPIQFGNVALLFGVLCAVRALAAWRWDAFHAALVVGAVSGVAASVFSQTRGGWLAVLLILSWVLAQTTRSWTKAKRWTIGVALAVVLAVPALQPNGIVQQRVGVAVAEFNAFFETGKQDTSVGARLAMWRVALPELVNAPWLGHGNQGWVEVRDAAIAKGTLSSVSAGVSHLHNEYLNVAFKRGLLGFVFYMSLFLGPMLYFFKPYLHDANTEVRALAIAGMVVPMMFMDFALTQSFLTHSSGRMVLCGLWMCVAGLMLNATAPSTPSVQEAPSH